MEHGIRHSRIVRFKWLENEKEACDSGAMKQQVISHEKARTLLIRSDKGGKACDLLQRGELVNAA